MIHRLPTFPPTALWARFAAMLSLLAVLSALLAPSAMLAEEVRTGKLGGLCSASAGWTGASGGAAGEAPAAAHCDLCASVGLALPPVVAQFLPTFAGHAVRAPAHPALMLASDPGLPFSRGPPAA